MQRGPSEQTFYAERTKSTGDQIVCVSVDEKGKLTSTYIKINNSNKLIAYSVVQKSDHEYD